MGYYDHWTADDFRRLGEQIRAERERYRRYAADQERITAQYCKLCGTKLDNLGYCIYCDYNRKDSGELPGSQDNEPAVSNICKFCGDVELVNGKCPYCDPDEIYFSGISYSTFPESQVSDMRHPTW